MRQRRRALVKLEGGAGRASRGGLSLDGCGSAALVALVASPSRGTKGVVRDCCTCQVVNEAAGPVPWRPACLQVKLVSGARPARDSRR